MTDMFARGARRAMVLLAAVASGCHGASPQRPTTVEASPPAADDPIATFIDDVRTRLHVPGIAVAIVRDGRARTYVRGNANVAWPSPVGTDTAFQIASVTKILTGTLVASLAADGTIALDAPVSRYLPDAPESWRAMTLADLAAHSSGLGPIDVPRSATVADVYAAARAQPLAYAPGTDVRYITTDLSILQLVIERVTGAKLVDLLRTHVFEPAGMRCTAFEDAELESLLATAEVVPRHATVYRWVGDRQRVAWGLYPQHSYASGGAFSCLDDLVRWASALDRGALLSPAVDRALTSQHHLRDGRASGFGTVFGVGTMRGRPIYGHSGGPALADVVRFPDDKLTVIVLTNQKRVYPTLALAIASLVLGPPAPAPAVHDARPALTAAHRRLIAALPAGDIDDNAIAPGARDARSCAAR